MVGMDEILANYPRPSPSTIPRLDDNCQVYPVSFPLHTTKDLAFSEKVKF